VQCATDTRLWLYGALQDVRASLADLIKAAVARAEAEVDVVMPGFTHLQPAMTVLLPIPHPTAIRLARIFKEAEVDVVMPGFTHLQPEMTVLLPIPSPNGDKACRRQEFLKRGRQ